MSLHFHVGFTPFWAVSHLACLIAKYEYLPTTYKVILIAIHSVTVIIEWIRLYLGYYGNLGEKIPALSGFWITTLILQLPITAFLGLNPGSLPLPLEYAVHFVQGVFLIVEVISGFVVIRRIADSQMTKFKRRVLDEEHRTKET